MATHIRITARRDGFRRAGLVHSTRPTDHPIGTLSEAQIEQIEADPSLKVELVDLADGDAGVADDDVMLLGSSVLPADVELAQGVIVPLGYIVRGAQLVSGLTGRAWNALDGDEIEARLNNFISAWSMVAAGAHQQRLHDSENTQGRSGTAREASSTSSGTQADQETGQADVGAQPAAQSSADPGLSADQGGAKTAEGGARDDEAPSSTNEPASSADAPQDAEQDKGAAPAEAKPAAPKPAGRKPAGKKAAAKGADKS